VGRSVHYGKRGCFRVAAGQYDSDDFDRCLLKSREPLAARRKGVFNIATRMPCAVTSPPGKASQGALYAEQPTGAASESPKAGDLGGLSSLQPPWQQPNPSRQRGHRIGRGWMGDPGRACGCGEHRLSDLRRPQRRGRSSVCGRPA
jgi:hypothetical protein